MKKDPQIFLFHILESIEAIEKFTQNIHTFEDFIKDQKTSFAVTRALEIIGEATKNLPKELRQKHKEVPWKQIAGTRDRLIHQYSGVDLKLMFKIVQEEIPVLKQQIEGILKKFPKQKLI